MSVVGVGEVLVVPSFKGVQREIGKELAGAGESEPVKKSGGKISATLIKGAKLGLAGGAAVLGTALVKGFGRLQAIENARAKLTGLGHDAGAVEGIMKNATAAVKGTAFGLGDAAGAAANLVAAGIKPGKELEKQLTLVGDAATIAGVGFGDMSSIFSKAASSNKVQMDIIGQLHDMGVPALQLIAQEMGVTAEEASKMASDGAVDFATFSAAMQKGMGGAAQESGKTLQGAFANSMAALGRFGANLMSGVYPQLTEFFGSFIEWMGPVEELGKVVGEKLGNALKSMVDWVVRNKDAIAGFLPVLATAVAGLGAYFAITKTMAAFKAIQTWYLATTVAQKGLNAAMRANPIGIVITVITALVAAIVWLYKNNETARRIIDAVWKAIKTAIKVSVDWIVGAWRNVGKWLTETLPRGFNSLRDKNKQVWEAIWSKINGIWTSIKTVFNAIKTWVSVTLAAVWNGLKSTVSNVWDGIKTKISNIWTNVKGTFNNIKNFLKDTLGPVFTWFRDKVIKPVWNGIKTAIKTVWDNGIKPVFDTISKVLKGDFKGAFQTAKDAIYRIWRGVANVVRKPINFVIGTVYNDGIRKVFNKVAGVVGIGKLDEAKKIPAFAKGGFHKGGWALVGEEGPELVNFSDPSRIYKKSDTQAMLSGKKQAPLGALDELRANGFGDAAHAGIGGFWGDTWNNIKGIGRTIGGAVKKGLDWVRGGLAKAAEWMLNPLLERLGSDLGTTGFGGIASGLAKKALNGVLKFLRGEDDKATENGEFTGGFTGSNGGFFRPVGGTITSLFGSSRGRYPHAGTDLAVPIGTAVKAAWNGVVAKAGWNVVGGRSGIGMLLRHAGGQATYYGHLSRAIAKVGQQVKAGQTIAKSGNTGRSTGPHLHFETWRGNTPYNNIGLLRGGSSSGRKHSLYDNGGILAPGLTAAMNLTRKPEAILTNKQWQAMSALAARGATQFPDKLTLNVEGHEFTAYVSEVADGRMRTAKLDARRGNRQMTGRR